MLCGLSQMVQIYLKDQLPFCLVVTDNTSVGVLLDKGISELVIPIICTTKKFTSHAVNGFHGTLHLVSFFMCSTLGVSL